MFLDLHINLSNHYFFYVQVRNNTQHFLLSFTYGVPALNSPHIYRDLGAFPLIYALSDRGWSAQVAREIVLRPLNPLCILCVLFSDIQVLIQR